MPVPTSENTIVTGRVIILAAIATPVVAGSQSD
jgi:hypothetical protein